MKAQVVRPGLTRRPDHVDVHGTERTFAAYEEEAPVVAPVTVVAVLVPGTQLHHDVVDRDPVVHGGDDVENGLGLKTGNRGAADVDHADGKIAQERAHRVAFALAQRGPAGVVRGEPDLRLLET